MELKGTKTYENLMRAFTGESQARNRYNFAASVAKKEGFKVIADVFDYTADQERAHAKVFYEALTQYAGEKIDICGDYPIILYPKTVDLLRAAQKGELEEWDTIYSNFASVAKDEGFTAISHIFQSIANIEKIHADRFGRLAADLEGGMIFKSSEETIWICTNCGHIHTGKEAPGICSVCKHPQGYFMPKAESLYER